MSSIFGNIIDQTVDRVMGSLTSEGVSTMASAQASVIGTATSAITNALGGGSLGRNVATSVVGGALSAINASFSKFVYNSTISVTGSISPFEYSGFSSDVTGDVPNQYIVRIHNSNPVNHVVRALLQEPFTMETNSDWVPFLNPKISDALLQASALLHTSLFPRFASRRIWKGTKPITMGMNLKFEAVSDSWKEVVLPCLRLMQMSLPGTSQITLPAFLSSAVITTLTPPGPSPFLLTADMPITWNNQDAATIAGFANRIVNSGADQIEISVGRMLKFTNVIIEKINIEYSNRIGANGLPMGAKVSVTFSTYEMYTKEAMADSHMYKG